MSWNLKLKLKRNIKIRLNRPMIRRKPFDRGDSRKSFEFEINRFENVFRRRFRSTKIKSIETSPWPKFVRWNRVIVVPVQVPSEGAFFPFSSFDPKIDDSFRKFSEAFQLEKGKCEKLKINEDDVLREAQHDWKMNNNRRIQQIELIRELTECEKRGLSRMFPLPMTNNARKISFSRIRVF